MALQLDGNTGIVYSNINQDIKSLLLPKNWIINGMFDVWQRGTSKVCTTDDRTFLADRFNVYLVSGTTCTASRQSFTVGQTTVPNNPTYFHRAVVVSGGGSASRCNIAYAIEDVTKLAGNTITISFWAKADASRNISIEFIQQFGTGGSTVITGIGVQKFALTTAWQRITKTITIPSITGKTIGTDHYTGLAIFLDAGSDYNSRTDSLGNQSGTFDIANISLVYGSVPVECQNQPYADVLRDCQRYFQTIVSTSDTSSYAKVGTGFASDTSTVWVIYDLIVSMRKTPNMSVSDATKFWCSDGSNNLTLTSMTFESNGINTVKINAIKTTSFTQFRPYLLERNGNVLGYIWADAEL